MHEGRELTELAERKRLLVAQADLHRAILRAEGVRVRSRFNWISEAREKVGAAGPWLALGAGALGILAARRWRNVVRWIPTALAIWRWIQKLKRPETDPE
jgi:hypothetical protein